MRSVGAGVYVRRQWRGVGMAEVKTRECDVPECPEVGPDVVTVHVRAQRVKSQVDLCREHRRPVVAAVELAGGVWSGRTTADEMALSSGELVAEL